MRVRVVVFERLVEAFVGAVVGEGNDQRINVGQNLVPKAIFEQRHGRCQPGDDLIMKITVRADEAYTRLQHGAGSTAWQCATYRFTKVKPFLESLRQGAAKREMQEIHEYSNSEMAKSQAGSVGPTWIS